MLPPTIFQVTVYVIAGNLLGEGGKRSLWLQIWKSRTNTINRFPAVEVQQSCIQNKLFLTGWSPTIQQPPTLHLPNKIQEAAASATKASVPWWYLKWPWILQTGSELCSFPLLLPYLKLSLLPFFPSTVCTGRWGREEQNKRAWLLTLTAKVSWNFPRALRLSSGCS